MNLGPLRELVLHLNMAAHGLAITVTRPAPDNTPVSTRGIWETHPQQEAQQAGSDYRRREPRRVLVIPREGLSSVPRGTTIAAPETLGGADKTWTVDGYDRIEADHWRVLVKL